MTGSPPASDGTIDKSGVALAHNGTFTQADINNGLITYISTGSAAATDSIAFFDCRPDQRRLADRPVVQRFHRSRHHHPVDFPSVAAAPDNSPAANIGTGTPITLGMTNSYTNGAGNSGSPATTCSHLRHRESNLHRKHLAHPRHRQQRLGQRRPGIHARASSSTPAPSAIPISSSASTGTPPPRASATSQVQYNTNGNDGSGSGWVNYQGFVATSNDFYNSQNSPVNPTIYINLASIAAANNDPDPGIRLVSAYDSTGLIPGSNGYASAVGEVANPIDSASDSV